MDNKTVEVDTKEKRKKGKVWTIFMTIIFSILLFVTALVAITVATVRNVVNDESVEKILDSVAVDKVIDAFGKVSGENVAFDDEAALINSFHPEGGQMTAEDFEEFLDDSSIKEFAASKISDYVSDIRTNGDDFTLKEKDIEKFLKENRDELEDASDYEFTNDDIKQISSRLMDFETAEKFYPGAIKEKNATIYYILRVVLSIITFIAVIAIAGLLIFALLKNNLSQGFMGIGIVLTIIGALFTVFALAVMLVPSILNSITGNALLGVVGGTIFSLNVLTYAIILAVGVLILVARSFIRKFIAKSRQNKEVLVK